MQHDIEGRLVYFTHNDSRLLGDAPSPVPDVEAASYLKKAEEAAWLKIAELMVLYTQDDFHPIRREQQIKRIRADTILLQYLAGELANVQDFVLTAPPALPAR
jgi:hypothetical protein